MAALTAQAATSVETFLAPATVAEAVAAKAELGDEAVFLAGGTDLGVQLRRRIGRPSHLISVTGIPDLAAIRRSDRHIIVGAAVTHRLLETSPEFAGSLEALREACRTIGSVQTRSVGTIGGNVCNASPAADTSPVLLALGASVEITGPAGSRMVGLDDFFPRYRATALAPDELLIAVHIPAPSPGTGSAFVKLGRRRAMEISIACVGVRVDVDADGTIAGAGIGLGSVAPTTVRARASEEALIGTNSDGAVAAASTLALEACDPIDDVRASADYRRAMVPVLVERALRMALERAGRTP